MNENRKYGLLEKDIDAIVSILSENNRINEVVLFGSRAKGSNSQGSDIDIAIKGKDITLDDLLTTKLSIDKLTLPYRIDLVIFERINNNDLVGHINRVGITLFNRDSSI